MYQSIFLMFRWPPKPEYDASEQRYHQLDMERKHKALAEELAPTNLQVRKRNLALDAFNDYQDYGVPYEGGSQGQPRWWKRAMRCVLKAQKDARWEIAQAEAESQQAEEDY